MGRGQQSLEGLKIRSIIIDDDGHDRGERCSVGGELVYLLRMVFKVLVFANRINLTARALHFPGPECESSDDRGSIGRLSSRVDYPRANN
jgi:hypothetical protein